MTECHILVRERGPPVAPSREACIDGIREIHWGWPMNDFYAMFKLDLRRGFNMKKQKKKIILSWKPSGIQPGEKYVCSWLLYLNKFIKELQKARKMLIQKEGLFSGKRQGQRGSPWSLSFQRQQGEEDTTRSLYYNQRRFCILRKTVDCKPLAARHTHRPFSEKPCLASGDVIIPPEAVGAGACQRQPSKGVEVACQETPPQGGTVLLVGRGGSILSGGK